MKRVFAMVMAVVMAAVMFAGCSAGGNNNASNNSGSGDTIKVGLLGPHSGEYAVYGLGVRNGAELYFKKVNEAGGINGKQIELVVYDNTNIFLKRLIIYRPLLYNEDGDEK